MMQGPSHNNAQGHMRYHVSQQQTMPQPMLAPPASASPTPGAFPGPQMPLPMNSPDQAPTNPTPTKKKPFARILAIFLVLGLACAIYFIWNGTPSTSSSSGITQSQQGFSSSGSPGSPVSTTDGIKAYITGAVRHPGVYALPSGARVYDLLQAAGGASPQANLVALNLAAKVSDGQEVYVTLIGEAPPPYMGGVSGTGGGITGGGTTAGGTTGQLVNINTASATELSQQLHIRITTAQAIVDYRSQHGNYSSVDQLSQVVSKSTYDKIKSQCTV